MILQERVTLSNFGYPPFFFTEVDLVGTKNIIISWCESITGNEILAFNIMLT